MNTLLDGIKELVKSFTPEQRTIIKGIAVKAFDTYADFPSFIKKMISPGRLEATIDKFLSDI